LTAQLSNTKPNQLAGIPGARHELPRMMDSDPKEIRIFAYILLNLGQTVSHKNESKYFNPKGAMGTTVSEC